MNESFNQISLETLTMIFQICAAFGIGTILLIMFACCAAIAFQMKNETRSVSVALKNQVASV